MRLRVLTRTLLATIPTLCASAGDVLPSIKPTISQAIHEFDLIPPERQKALSKAAQFIRLKRQAGEDAQLIFICTHNSRRSHLSQIWAQTAAAYYNVPRVKTFSGGTEATACNARTVAALQRAGFEIRNSTPGENNPVYLVRYSPSAEPFRAFSKVCTDGGNPRSDFAAMMTCDTADGNCPVVAGSVLRLSIPFVDPKVADGTETETATYDERCRQIAREMLYLMKQASQCPSPRLEGKSCPTRHPEATLGSAELGSDAGSAPPPTSQR